MQVGRIHIYYGDGKGKTTAAFGLALRALGSDLKVIVVQFLKSANSGECKALESNSNACLLGSSCSKFILEMNEKEKNQATNSHNEILKTAIQKAKNESFDVLILDELLDALSLGMIDKDLVKTLLCNNNQLELIITGHEAIDWVFDKADYITCMKKEKHPYDLGVCARKGIEF